MTENSAPITQQELTTARVDFKKRNFDILVEQKGLNLCHEKAIRCSCVMEVNGSPLSDCVSCNGSGWIWYDLKEIKGVLTGIGFDPKFMQYSRVNLGTANLTVRYDDAQRLSWFDRITLVDGQTVFHENIFPHLRTGDTVAQELTTYSILEIDKIFLFIDANTQQQELVVGTDFTFSGRSITLSTELRNELIQQSGNDIKKCISIRYRHRPQYVVMDLQNDIRNTNVVTTGGSEELNHMPIHALVKRLHYVVGDKGFE